MVCHQCGAEQLDDAILCSRCGTTLKATASTGRHRSSAQPQAADSIAILAVTVPIQRRLIVALNGPAGFRSIQDAIDAATPGDAVVVKPGIYREALLLEHPLEMLGDGPVSDIIVECGGQSCLTMNANRVLVKGLSFHLTDATVKDKGDEVEPSTFALQIVGGAVRIEDCIIAGGCNISRGPVEALAPEVVVIRCQIHKTDGLAGVVVRRMCRAAISNCNILNNNYYGVRVENNGAATIDFCDIRYNCCGIDIDNEGEATVRNCQIHDNKGDGVLIRSVGKVVVENCDMFLNKLSGVAVTEGEATIQNCRLHDNHTGVTVDKNGIAEIHQCNTHYNTVGVGVRGNGNAKLSECEIHVNKKHGVVVTSKGASELHSCQIHNNVRFGLMIEENGRTLIRGCNIFQSSTIGVVVRGKGFATIQNCVIQETDDGAGVVTQKLGKAIIQNCDIQVSRAIGHIQLTENDQLTLQNCRIVENENHSTNVSSLSACNFQLCIRLDQATAESEEWLVVVGFVLATDPSVLVLKGSDQFSEMVPTLRTSAEKSYFQEIQAASDIWPPLKRGDPETGRTTVTATEVVELVQNVDGRLFGSGVLVQLPSYLQKDARTKRIVARFSVDASDIVEGFGADALLSARLDLAVDDESLTADELEQMARLKQPLVRLRGKWVYFDPKDCDPAELKRIIARVLSGASQPVSAGEMVHDVLSSRFGSTSIPIEVTNRRLQDLIDRLAQKADIPLVDPPKALKATLRPYQQVGYSWLCFLSDYQLGACLADDMGLGKTLQTVAWLLRAQKQQKGQPSLLVCPKSLLGNWQREAKKFAPSLRVYLHHGTSRESLDTSFSTLARKHDVIITTYSLLDSDLKLFKAVKWRAVILDEAQNIKNDKTTQSRAARQLSAGTAFRLALTGTPIENHVGDLWPIMEFLNPGLLGSRAWFENKFVAPIRNDGDRAARESLKQSIQPFVLRRLKSDPQIAPDLPEKCESTVLCLLTREQAEWYCAVLKDLEKIPTSDNRPERISVLTVLTKLKQTCNHPALLLKDRSTLGERSGKLNRLVEMLEEVLDNGEKTLIFTQYAEMAKMLDTFLRDRFRVGTNVLSGACSAQKREEIVKQFQEDPAFPILILTQKAGGVGLNLTAATHVFHFDRWWNPAVEDQATDRAHRIGQTKLVSVHKFVCIGTLEERIAKMLDEKRSLSKELLGEVNDDSLAGYLSKLNVEDLREFLHLDEEAVGDD